MLCVTVPAAVAAVNDSLHWSEVSSDTMTGSQSQPGHGCHHGALGIWSHGLVENVNYLEQDVCHPQALY